MEEKINCHICASQDVQQYCVKNGHTIYQCGNCFLAFVWPLPRDSKNLYTKEYYHGEGDSHGYMDYDDDKEPMKSVFLRYLAVIEESVVGKKICDVGAATGYFLDLAKNAGWETYGSEISSFAAGVAKKRGHRVVEGDLSLMEKSAYFDAVTMWDVLEHVESPRAYLQETHRLLKDGGIVVINTIDMNSLWARLLGRRWNMLIPPEHLYYFSLNNLSALLEQTGFTILERKTIGKKFSLAYIFKTLYNWQKIFLWKILAHAMKKPPFQKIAFPLNVGDNVFVLAQKKGIDITL